MIGVNGRDLDTLDTDLDRVAEMLPEVAAPFRIAESGVRGRQDVERLLRAGANGFLIGETLMRAPRPEAVFEELLHG
jgi:indole-3-glycerol phosphate synthase